MPRYVWEHEDCCGAGLVWTGSPEGPGGRSCGKPLGWLPTALEEQAAYQWSHDFNVRGPHRVLVDQLLGPHRIACSPCSGRGIMGTDDDASWRVCPVCEGTGGHWTCTEEERWQARRTIMDAFPDALALDAPARFLGVSLVLDPDTGTVVAAEQERPKTGPIDLGHGIIIDPEKDLVRLNGVLCRVSATGLGPAFTRIEEPEPKPAAPTPAARPVPAWKPRAPATSPSPILRGFIIAIVISALKVIATELLK